MTSRLAALLLLCVATRVYADPWVDPRPGHGWAMIGTGYSNADQYLSGPGEIDAAGQPLRKGTRRSVALPSPGLFGFVLFDGSANELQGVVRGEVSLYRGLGFVVSMPLLRDLHFQTSESGFGSFAVNASNGGVGDLVLGLKYQVPIPRDRAYGFAFGPQLYFTAPTGDSRGAAVYDEIVSVSGRSERLAIPATTGDGTGAVEVRLSAGYRSTRVPLFVTADLGYRHHLVRARCHPSVDADALVSLSDDLPYAVHAGAEWQKHWRGFDHLRVSADLSGVRSVENHDVPSQTLGRYVDGCVQNNNVSRFSFGGTIAWFPIRIFGLSYSISHVLVGVNTPYSLDQNVGVVFEW